MKTALELKPEDLPVTIRLKSPEGSKYPTAEPEALMCEPLKAAGRVANAARTSVATLRWPVSATGSSGPSAGPRVPGCEYSLGSQFYLAHG